MVSSLVVACLTSSYVIHFRSFNAAVVSTAVGSSSDESGGSSLTRSRRKADTDGMSHVSAATSPGRCKPDGSPTGDVVRERPQRNV